MTIVLFTHPIFRFSHSMSRFASLIKQGMEVRGHSVEVWSPSPIFHRLPAPHRYKKWLGYIDQYFVFPHQIRSRLKKMNKNTLFIFTDQVHGPWVPLVKKLPHVIHIHDLIAIRSAQGEFEEYHHTSWSGRIYQSMIRHGLEQSRCFISVSKKTLFDLNHSISAKPQLSEYIYNGLYYPFKMMSRTNCNAILSSIECQLCGSGFMLHVGGNQWYKNRLGVLDIYKHYVEKVEAPLPLLLVGEPPTNEMQIAISRMGSKSEIIFVKNLTNVQMCAIYSSARLLLFPSLAEGFGWPIAEAMACGCPVLTTNEAPMTEVGGDAAFYIPRRPGANFSLWAHSASGTVIDILALPAEELERRRVLGYVQSGRFDIQCMLDAYENFYLRALSNAGAMVNSGV